MTTTPTIGSYYEHKAIIDPLAAEMERIAYRLRQGAISPELAVEKLAAIPETLRGLK